MSEDRMYAVQFTSHQAPADMIKMPDGLPPERVTRLSLKLTQEEFAKLELPEPITRYMYAEGNSYEQFSTTIVATDVVIQESDQENDLHGQIIKGLHRRRALQEPDGDAVCKNAVRIDKISVGALAFMLEMHEQWMDPVEDPGDFSEVLDMAESYNLTLDDFYRIA